MKNLALSSLSSIIILLFVFACRDPKPVDSSKLAERGGLVYYKRADTPFSGKGIKYWLTGEVQVKAIYKDDILV